MRLGPSKASFLACLRRLFAAQELIMSALVQIAIHPSQFPDRVRADLLTSLSTRQVQQKFHYDSVKQTQKWLALHAACSPARTDPDCADTYDRAFAGAIGHLDARGVHLFGLGCGGGQKDTRLLRLLRQGGKETSYTPVDVSAAMVLVARQTALAQLPTERCFPLVCDLGTADDLPRILEEQRQAKATRLLTFFGMMPNFEPQLILPRLAGLLQPHDVLLVSANLAPGPDYDDGIRRILPQYDNALTRDWLMTFLLDLGVEKGDGQLAFDVQEFPEGSGLKRLVARFEFKRPRTLQVDEHILEYAPGDRIRLFFSYRYTRDRVRNWLAKYGLRVLGEWVAASEEEGVFLVGKMANGSEAESILG